MQRRTGQKGFSFGMQGSGRAFGETLCASLTSVGLYSVCLSVCLSVPRHIDTVELYSTVQVTASRLGAWHGMILFRIISYHCAHCTLTLLLKITMFLGLDCIYMTFGDGLSHSKVAHMHTIRSINGRKWGA